MLRRVTLTASIRDLMPILHLDSRRLARLLRTAAAYRTLDQTEACGGTWCEGGCALLAFALSSLIRGSTVMTLCSPRTKPQHLVVRLPEGRYADGEGIHTHRALLRHWRWIEDRHGPITLRPVTLCRLDCTEIPHDPHDIAIIRAFLARALHPPNAPGRTTQTPSWRGAQSSEALHAPSPSRLP